MERDQNQEAGIDGAPMILQSIADIALTTSLSSYALKAQMNCQYFCEKKSMEDA